MKLSEWLKGWRYAGRNGEGRIGELPNGRDCFVVPDDPSGHTRTWAFGLSDYKVSTVTGGSIYFVPVPVQN